MIENNFFGGRLRIFSQLYKEYMKPFIDAKDISYNQYFYLNTIRSIPGCNQNFLVELFRSKKSLVSITLKDLEEKNLIIQETDPDNRRSYMINITPEGNELVEYLNIQDKKCQKKINKLMGLPYQTLQENIDEICKYMFTLDNEDEDIILRL